MLRGFETPESWFLLAMQVWKNIINFVYVFPEKLSSLRQIQCLMLLLTLNKSLLHMKNNYQRLISLSSL